MSEIQDFQQIQFLFQTDDFNDETIDIGKI